MATLYGTFPILLPGTTESVSRNGLKKTSGTILFKAGQESDAISTAATHGHLFPEPQIIATDIGLLEMSFDAYQDTGQSTGVFGSEILNLSNSYTYEVPINGDPNNLNQFNWTVSETWLVDSYTEHKVIPAGQSSVFLQPAALLLQKDRIQRIIRGKIPSNGATQLSIGWQSQVSNVTRRNFGIFDEVDIVTTLVGSL